MRATHSIDRVLGKAERDDFSGLKVVILYDEFWAGQRALRVFQSALAGLADETLAEHSQLWRFDLLKDPEQFLLSLKHAADANMVIISVNRTNSPPSIAMDWIERWVAGKHEQTAAVVVLPPHQPLAGQGLSALESLRTTVERAGLDFLTPSPSDEELLNPSLENVCRTDRIVPRRV